MLLSVEYVLHVVPWTVLWWCWDHECGGGTWSAGQGQPLLSMRNSQMAGDSWGNSCKCNLRGCLICGIAQACIHCILGLLWRNILNKSRWLCSVSQRLGLLTTFWRWFSLALGPTKELSLFHCAACAQQTHVDALTVLVSVLFGAKMGCCSESLATHTWCWSLVCLLYMLAVLLQL